MNEEYEMTVEQDREAFLKELEKNRITWKHVVVGVLTVLVFVVLITFEVRAMTSRVKKLGQSADQNVQKSFTADDEVIQKYFPFNDRFLSPEPTELLGKRYSEICELFGHPESDRDFADGNNGFCFTVMYDQEVTIDLHFKDNALFRVALYSGEEDYDKALSIAGEKYGNMISCYEQKKRCCFLYDDSCDYWVWNVDGSTHQQYISRYQDNISYYISDELLTKDCLELIGQSYMQICQRFGFEMSEDDLNEDGEGYFKYTVFDYTDDSKDEVVRFEFTDRKLSCLEYHIPAEKGDIYETLAANADKEFGEPYFSTEDVEIKYYRLENDYGFNLKKWYDGSIVEKIGIYK